MERQRIPISNVAIQNEYWLKYRVESGIYTEISLSSCANSFALKTGYPGDDTFKCVGWHYSDDVYFCYELFTIGHIIIYMKKHPSIFQKVLYQLQGKNPSISHQQKLLEFEKIESTSLENNYSTGGRIMHFLSYDSRFWQAIRNFFDYTFLGLLWVLASIPLLTFGAATTAMFQAADSSIRKAEGHIFITFWKQFCAEFKQATLLWLLAVVILASLVIDGYLLAVSNLSGILLILLYGSILFLFCWIHLWFGYLAKFHDKTRTILGNTFYMVGSNLVWILLLCLLTVFVVCGILISIFFMPPLTLIIPGIYVVLSGSLYRRIFRKYIS